MEQAAIRQRIKEMVHTGELPCEEPEATWGSNGDGHRCDGCMESIRSDEIEYEVSLSSGMLIRLHRQCHAIWLQECESFTEA
jgi:hypothetical protein